jgi:hypothetical protein
MDPITKRAADIVKASFLIDLPPSPERGAHLPGTSIYDESMGLVHYALVAVEWRAT